MAVKIVTTDRANGKYFSESAGEFLPEQGEEMNLVCVFPKKKYQKILGFGGAFTQAAAYAWKHLDEEQGQEAVNAYYGPEGLCYTLGRTHINSCDFSLGNYTYVEEGDENLSTFSIECEEKYQLPLLRAAREAAGSLTLLASPWSPPAYMKTNGSMNGGGKLKPSCRKLWANYIAAYLNAYREKGFAHDFLTIQNEPKAVQTWDSCVYTPEEEREFAEKYLAPALKEKGISARIIAWDHNKERLYENAGVYFSGDSVIAGEGFHWYSGDHFEQLKMASEDYPDKLFLFTEGCVEYSRYDRGDTVRQAEMYAHDMIGNFNHGCHGFLDWNLFLDENGGPNHVGNFCAAPVMIDTKKGKIQYQLSYYYIGQISRYVKPGAVRIGCSRYTDRLDAAAFQNPDGSTAVVLVNRGEKEEEVLVRKEGKICRVQMQPHSISTVIEE